MTTTNETTERLFVTREEAAIALSVSEMTVKRLTRSGELPSIRMGNRVLVPWDALRDLAREACKRRHPSNGGSR